VRGKDVKGQIWANALAVCIQHVHWPPAKYFLYCCSHGSKGMQDSHALYVYCIAKAKANGREP